ncbi:MAG: lysostaphin resistance A-like protein [Chloroflexota bacterium]|nr:CPBP family intramembrane metalloprotease [Dehalococcoidia bacterium]MDW8254382.1 lysostaphin resistance A-like protein [Chloroflexota bacterium]
MNLRSARRLPFFVDRWLLVMAVLGIAGVGIVLLFRDRGVPIAAIEFRVLQPGAEATARAFLEARGVDLRDFRASVSFETDRDAQGYLERVAGQRALDRIAAAEATIWRWRVRFFRELDPLEYLVSVRPDGAVVGWARVLPEAAAAPSLDEEAARTLAETALQSAGRTLAGWSLVGAARETRPNRVDYRFTWERDDWQVGDARLRQTVLVQGDTVGGWFDFVRTPESWVRALRIETNRGVVLANIGWTLTYAIGLAAATVFLAEWRAGRTRRGVPLALMGGFLIVGLAALFNQLPLWVASAPTTMTVGAYVLAQLRDQLGQLVPSLAVVGMAAAAGLALWPRAFPQLPHPLADLTPAGWRTRRFVTAVLFGYLAAGAWLGYFTVYYWLGSAFFGVWSPVELPYRDVMSGAFPPAFPLVVGAAAAIAEETVFRLFAIPAGTLALAWLWKRGTGRSPRRRAQALLVGIVIVVAALVWGSLHSTYPQLPFYVRAVEVAVIGVLAGVVLLRWGLVATLTTHYVGNTSVVGVLFLLSGNPALQAGAIVVIALPLLSLVPAALALLRGSALPDLPPQPTLAPVSPPTAPSRSVPSLRPWPAWTLVVAVAALGAVAVFAPPRPHDALRMATTREEAVLAAAQALRQIGAPVDFPLVVAEVVDRSGGAEATFLLRTLGPAETARFYETTLPPAVWNVRFVRPLQKEEAAVQIGPSGTLAGVARQVEETAPGAAPTLADARAVAERWLQELTGRSAWSLVSASQTRRDQRVDSVFVWERADWSAGPAEAAATLRVQIVLYGNELGLYQPFLKLPEEFVRALRRDTGVEGAVRTARDLALLGVGVVVVVFFVRSLRRSETDVMLGGKLAAFVGLALLVSLIADLPRALASYSSTLDLPGFALWRLSSQVRESLLVLGAVVALGMLVPVLLRQQGQQVAPPTGREVALGLLGALGVVAAAAAGWALHAWLAPATLRAPAGLPPFDGALPAALAASLAVQRAVVGGTVAAVVLLIVGRLPARGQLAAAAALGGLVGAADRVGPEAAVGGVLGAGGALLFLLFGRVAGPSLWAPMIALGGAALVSEGVGLLRYSAAGWYLSNGVVLLALIPLLAAGLLRRRFRARRVAPPASGTAQ